MTKQAHNPYRAEDEEEARTLVAETRIEYVVCAVRGHRFPDLLSDDGKKTLPPGFRVGPIRKDGLFDVTEICQVCGEEVWYLSQADQIFGGKKKRNYKRPEDRPIIARGVSRGVWADELNAEMSAAIVAAAKRAAKAAERAAAKEAQRNRVKSNLKSVS